MINYLFLNDALALDSVAQLIGAHDQVEYSSEVAEVQGATN